MQKRTNHANRLLGRRVAREFTREELQTATGVSPTKTITFSYPPDRDRIPGDADWI